MITKLTQEVMDWVDSLIAAHQEEADYEGQIAQLVKENNYLRKELQEERQRNNFLSFYANLPYQPRF